MDTEVRLDVVFHRQFLQENAFADLKAVVRCVGELKSKLSSFQDGHETLKADHSIATPARSGHSMQGRL
ncbi:hypothetical protein GOP47_0008765 [Adiantum capillus-veneris]|uniref:Uncharacterized protein n=1 Tax=Adiantum capillus-veneris TaxID=13818 RepID=A0A9D4UZL2_ADICA|nr:hypothetical protein GOP47_0008765 [Adiantum capillus-veneris]